MARGPNLVESCREEVLHYIAALWLRASGKDRRSVAPPGTYIITIIIIIIIIIGDNLTGALHVL